MTLVEFMHQHYIVTCFLVYIICHYAVNGLISLVYAVRGIVVNEEDEE